MAADKASCKNIGVAVYNLIVALEDGFSATEDSDEILALVTGLGTNVNSIAGDLDAAIPYILSGAAEAFGDAKVDAE